MVTDNDTKLEVALLQKDVSILNAIILKLDPVIDKLQGTSADVTRMLALHEQKFLSVDEKQKDMANDLKEVRDDIKNVSNNLRDFEKNTMVEFQNMRDALTEAKLEVIEDSDVKKKTNLKKKSRLLRYLPRFGRGS